MNKNIKYKILLFLYTEKFKNIFSYIILFMFILFFINYNYYIFGNPNKVITINNNLEYEYYIDDITYYLRNHLWRCEEMGPEDPSPIRHYLVVFQHEPSSPDVMYFAFNDQEKEVLNMDPSILPDRRNLEWNSVRSTIYNKDYVIYAGKDINGKMGPSEMKHYRIPIRIRFILVK